MPLRHQDPTTGRWTGIDPVTHFSASTYSAFNNNPVFWTDPSGGIEADAKFREGYNDDYNQGIRYDRIDKGKKYIGDGGGATPDYYSHDNDDGSTSVVYKKGNAENITLDGQVYNNIGSSISVQNIDETYTIYYQNAGFISQNSMTGAEVLASRDAVNSLMNILGGEERQRAFIGSMHSSTGIAADIIFEIGMTAAAELKVASSLYRLGKSWNIGSKFVKLSSKIGRSRAGHRVFSFQARFPKLNLNLRLDRGFRSAFKNTKQSYLGKAYNGFNTHINIQVPGKFNFHLPLNPLKWKYYNIR